MVLCRRWGGLPVHCRHEERLLGWHSRDCYEVFSAGFDPSNRGGKFVVQENFEGEVNGRQACG